MLTASPITRQTVGKTFSITISTLGVGAILQLGIIGWAFATRPPDVVAKFPSMEVPAVARLSTTPPALSQPDLNADPLEDQPSKVTASDPRKPTPVPQRPAMAEPANRFEEVILQGRQSVELTATRLGRTRSAARLA